MRRFILGTDWWTDCDDAVAIRVLAAAAAREEITVAGVVVNAYMPESAASALGYLAHEGLRVPVALDRAATDYGGRPSYQHRVAETLGASYGDADCEEPVPMLRRLLAASPDGATEFIEIGYPQCLAALLASAPDGVSPLGGIELVRKKVSRLWMMAGNYENEARGRENNFARNARSAAAGAAVCRDWPTPVTFLGWEAGASVLSGGKLDPRDVLAQILADHGSARGRSSWDPMTVCLALHGSPEAAGYRSVCGRVSVDDATGENSFIRDAAGMHEYVVKTRPDAAYAEEIDTILAAAPGAYREENAQ